jgi:hypothetical protein
VLHESLYDDGWAVAGIIQLDGGHLGQLARAAALDAGS